MSFPNGTIGEIIKVLDMAGVEMLAISLPDSLIVDVTASLAETWDCSKYEVIGQQLSQSETSPFYAHYINADLTGIDGTPDLQVEIVKQAKNGAAISRKFRPKHHKDGSSEYLLLVGKQAAKADLEQQDEHLTRLKLAVEAGGYSSLQADYMANKMQLDPEIYHILGLDPQTTKMTVSKWMTLVHPQDQDQTVSSIASKNDNSQKFLQTSYRIKHNDGHYVWLELIARLVNDPITKVMAKVIGLCRDISQEMHQRHQTETSEQNLARSQALAKMGSWVMDLASNSVDWSDQMYVLLGIDKSDRSNHNFQSLTSAMDIEQQNKWQQSLEQAKNGHPVSGLEFEFNHSNGKRHTISIHIDIEYNSDGKPAKLHGICQDITDQTLLERKFLQAQKMESVGQLTGGIAHDFNNLLLVVLGNLQLIEKLTRGDQKATSRLNTAIDAVNKGSELTKRLLAFSRQQTLEDDTIDVNELITEAADMVTQAITSDIELIITPGKDIWPVKADKTQLETAILNLAINARDAMKDGGKLIIETHNADLDRQFTARHKDMQPGDYVLVSVSDTGHGMPASIIDKVLEPFFTTKAPGSGSGLGLSMIYDFVKHSKGYLIIHSEENVGSTIEIFLPRCHESSLPESSLPDETQQQQQTSGPERHQKKPVILIAEDNGPVRDVAVAMIEEMDYLVIDASDGEKALEIINMERKDMDI